MTALQTTTPTFDDVWRTIQELALMSKETDRQMKETDKMIKAMCKQSGSHGERLSAFVQEMLRPAVVRLFSQRHLPVHQIIGNMDAFDDNGRFKVGIDMLVIHSDTAIAFVCQSHMSQNDVDEHLERLAIFKDCFPLYGKFTILGAVAAMVLPEAVGHYAYRKGLFVLAQSGDAMEIRNDDAFKPHQW